MKNNTDKDLTEILKEGVISVYIGGSPNVDGGDWNKPNLIIWNGELFKFDEIGVS